MERLKCSLEVSNAGFWNAQQMRAVVPVSGWEPVPLGSLTYAVRIVFGDAISGTRSTTTNMPPLLTLGRLSKY